jgi:hypothetical protein
MTLEAVLLRQRRFAISLLFVVLGVCRVHAAGYASPDGAIRVAVNTRTQNDCEAVVQFNDHGRELLSVSYVSADHEHGSCINTAAWTADSQFFAYSLYSSGGHQPWHAPITFFSRKENRVLALGSYLPNPVTEADFSLSDPDILFCATTKIPLGEKPPVRRSIHRGMLDLSEP